MKTKVASEGDLPQLHALDQMCFPPGDLDWKPATPDELKNGVSGGRVWVTVDDNGKVIAFLHYETPTYRHIYISALAVHPDRRHQGLASKLLQRLISDQCVASNEPKSLTTVTSPKNYEMLGLLFSRGFIVRTFMPDYFGPGRDRFYCQYKSRIEYLDPDECFIVPVTARPRLTSLLSSGHHVITALVTLPAGHAFEVSRFEREDISSLQAEEAQSSIGFSSGVLAAITFLLGLSFTSANYPNAVRLLLTAAALSTTMSLIVFANAAGELARLRKNIFDDHMKLGNVLAEFGGVYPFLIALPVTFSGITNSTGVAFFTGGSVTLTLLLYERSRYSISRRFRQSGATIILMTIYCTAPITGSILIKFVPVQRLWSISAWILVIGGALVLQASTYMYRRERESGLWEKPKRWQIRK